jgi:hypothetical protein
LPAPKLEFKAVVVMACDEDVLPLQSRIESVADEVELDDIYDTERQHSTSPAREPATG